MTVLSLLLLTEDFNLNPNLITQVQVLNLGKIEFLQFLDGRGRNTVVAKVQTFQIGPRVMNQGFYSFFPKSFACNVDLTFDLGGPFIQMFKQYFGKHDPSSLVILLAVETLDPNHIVFIVYFLYDGTAIHSWMSLHFVVNERMV